MTGASGFLGGRLVEVLAGQGAAVAAYVRRADPGPALRRTGARLLTSDLTDPAAVEAAIKGTDVLVHCAFDWEDAGWNKRALDALIKACVRTGCRLVHVSSYVVYQIPDNGEMTEDCQATPTQSGYAHIKRALEDDVLRAVHEQSLSAVVLQPTLIYGPRSGPFTDEPADMLQFGTVVLPDNGEGLCNVVYVDDVVSAIILAARDPAAVGQRFLVSGPVPVTWREFYERIAQTVGTAGPRYRAAAALARASTRPRKILRLAADPERVVRKIAQHGRFRRFVQLGIRVLPPSYACCPHPLAAPWPIGCLFPRHAAGVRSTCRIRAVCISCKAARRWGRPRLAPSSATRRGSISRKAWPPRHLTS